MSCITRIQRARRGTRLLLPYSSAFANHSLQVSWRVAAKPQIGNPAWSIGIHLSGIPAYGVLSAGMRKSAPGRLAA
jgi:hypothetical protein